MSVVSCNPSRKAFCGACIKISLVIWIPTYLTVSIYAQIHQRKQPWWCPPAGLTKSQKRRIQRLRNWEQQKKILEKKVKSRVWCIKPRGDDKQDPSSSAAPGNTISTYKTLRIFNAISHFSQATNPANKTLCFIEI